MRKFNKHGFTLAELLIVVAIIAVLVAVAIPVFNNQLEKARETTDVANLRSAYAEALATFLDTGNGEVYSTTYKVQQRSADWQKAGVADALPSELSTAANGLKALHTAGNVFQVKVEQDESVSSAGIKVTLSSGTVS